MAHAGALGRRRDKTRPRTYAARRRAACRTQPAAGQPAPPPRPSAGPSTTTQHAHPPPPALCTLLMRVFCTLAPHSYSAILLMRVRCTRRQPVRQQGIDGGAEAAGSLPGGACRAGRRASACSVCRASALWPPPTMRRNWPRPRPRSLPLASTETPTESRGPRAVRPCTLGRARRSARSPARATEEGRRRGLRQGGHVPGGGRAAAASRRRRRCRTAPPPSSAVATPSPPPPRPPARPASAWRTRPG
jgi:hypothetical protein